MVWMTAAEALDVLNVRPQTLYANVSRGKIRAKADGDDPRRSLYHRDDVLRMARRANGRRTSLPPPSTSRRPRQSTPRKRWRERRLCPRRPSRCRVPPAGGGAPMLPPGLVGTAPVLPSPGPSPIRRRTTATSPKADPGRWPPRPARPWARQRCPSTPGHAHGRPPDGARRAHGDDSTNAADSGHGPRGAGCRPSL